MQRQKGRMKEMERREGERKGKGEGKWRRKGRRPRRVEMHGKIKPEEGKWRQVEQGRSLERKRETRERNGWRRR